MESCRAAGLHQASGLSELQRRGAGPQDPAGEMQTHISMEQQMNCQPVIQAGGISSVDGTELKPYDGQESFTCRVLDMQTARGQVYGSHIHCRVRWPLQGSR